MISQLSTFYPRPEWRILATATTFLPVLWNLMLITASSVYAQGAQTGQQWAVIICVQDHDEQAFNNVHFTQNDAVELRRVLVERAGVSPSRIIELLDHEAQPDKRPTLSNIRTRLKQALTDDRIGPNDQIIVYFSGHGLLVDERTFLVPADAKRNDVKNTCYPVNELNELMKSCRAGNKFLVLDSCHAGGDIAETLGSPDGDDFVDAINADSIPGCVVIASSSKQESSWEWPERRQGLFSYWFCKGLEGGADVNGNSQITLSEIYNYTEQHVRRTAHQVIQKRQTPVRYVNFKIVSDPVVLTLLHEHPESVCRRIAAHLDLDAREHGLKRIGFLEFRTPIGNKDELARVNLPRLAADRIRIAMNALRSNAYSVASATDLGKAPGSKALTVEGLGEPESLQSLKEQDKKLDAVVWGRLDRRKDRITLQCELLQVATGDRLSMPSGSFPLSGDLFGDWGASFDNTDAPQTESPFAPEVVEHINRESRIPPTQKPDFPFRVEIWSLKPRIGETAFLIGDESVRFSAGQKRLKSGQQFVVNGINGRTLTGAYVVDGRQQRGTSDLLNARAAPRRKEFMLTPGDVERNRELLVAAETDELFEIRIQNRLGSDVAMTLLVDGINTRGLQREWLGKAKSWVIPPTGDDTYRVVEGWYPETTAEKLSQNTIGTNMKRFRFGKASNALASRRGFGDALGVITAAFYGPSGRAVGVAAGPEEYRELEMKTFRPGDLLGVINLRYMDASELDNYGF